MDLELCLRMEGDDDLFQSRHIQVWQPWSRRAVQRFIPELTDAFDGRVEVVTWDFRRVLAVYAPPRPQDARQDVRWRAQTT
ncbi:hypothetical protein CBZ_10560 [Cellulomonas biazotea]|uniref:Uncharacterized protein n=1 Tax=Cellulomonas biazotea TaxID=1709 RepID=A0A402DPE5_9CELL|nr:hypothetical protein CBZ_10560 [Cellulomonas biazotea]